MKIRDLERIAAGGLTLTGLVFISDGIEAIKTVSEDIGFWKTLTYVDGPAMIAGGLAIAAYATYHLVRDLYQQYKEEIKS